MKKVPVMLAIGVAMIMSRSLGEVAAGDRKDNNGIPQSALAGKFATVMHGTFALCLDPTSNFAEISCTHPKAQVFPQTDVEIGHSTFDTKGNGCNTTTDTFSDFPVNKNPPFVAVLEIVTKQTSYDPETASGDGSFLSYVDGKCEGVHFDGAGATINSTGTFHFVLSKDGNHYDDVNTSLTDPVGGIGDFSLSSTGQQQ